MRIRNLPDVPTSYEYGLVPGPRDNLTMIEKEA